MGKGAASWIAAPGAGVLISPTVDLVRQIRAAHRRSDGCFPPSKRKQPGEPVLRVTLSWKLGGRLCPLWGAIQT